MLPPPFVHDENTDEVCRPKGETAIWTLDKDTKECLNYEGVPAVPKLRKATVPNPRAFLKTRGEIEIRNDLIDCGIDVCSAEVTPFSIVQWAS